MIAKTLRSRKKKRKLTIRGFKKKPKLPSDFEDTTWAKLQAGVRAVFHHEATDVSYEELYRGVENLCIHKKSEKLCERLQIECGALIREKIEALVGHSPDMSVFLASVDKMWRNHCQQISLVRNIFMYLDRTYMAHNQPNVSLRSVWDIGLHFLRLHLKDNPEVSERTLQGILQLIRSERDGAVADRSLMKSLLEMYWALGLYKSTFEPRLLRTSAAYYEVEAERVLRDFDIRQLLAHIDRRLREEQDRVAHYLQPCTEPRLVAILDTHFLERRIGGILERGFRSLMERSAYHHLGLMYQLFERVHALPKLCLAYREHIVSTGTKAVCDKSKDREMVQLLLQMKRRADACVAKAFRGDKMFVKANEEAFVSVINSRQNRPAELLAKFVDRQMRATNKSLAADVERLLERVMVLFRYINGKDVFEAFYKEDLARRLLLEQSASLDLERFMIQRLKVDCGSVYTNKMEGMFKDIDISKDFNRVFARNRKDAAARAAEGNTNGDVKAEAAGEDEPEMFVHLLTTGFWPSYNTLQLALPPSIKRQERVFTGIYTSRYSGRRLAWQHRLGHCVVRAFYPLGRKELIVSLSQATVLLLFNRRSRWTLGEIEGAMMETSNPADCRAEHEHLLRVMKSLCSSKARLLRALKPKQAAGGTSSGSRSSGAIFQFNEAFSAKLFRLRVNSIQSKETRQQQQATSERVGQGRQYQIDACIVRTMKTRRMLRHNMLIAEIVKQLRFPAKPILIKKRIESLLEREYMKRDPAAQNTYHYVA